MCRCFDDFVLVAKYWSYLSAVWRFGIAFDADMDFVDAQPRLEKLELFPTGLRGFRAGGLEGEADHEWA